MNMFLPTIICDETGLWGNWPQACVNVAAEQIVNPGSQPLVGGYKSFKFALQVLQKWRDEERWCIGQNDPILVIHRDNWFFVKTDNDVVQAILMFE